MIRDMENLCPCDSGQQFSDCCEPIINGERLADSPAQLMRSRYTAYATGAIDWVIASNHADSRESIDREEIERWSQQSTWLGLTISDTSISDDDPDEGWVTFRVKYRLDGTLHTHREKSRFVREGDAWFFHTAFDDAEEQPELVPVTSGAPEAGRNDPCPCGSGAKFKRCCGAL